MARRVGRGRVVVVGEAAMLTAQTTDAGRRRFGMSWPGTDDRQFALNVVHWLSGALDAPGPPAAPAPRLVGTR